MELKLSVTSKQDKFMHATADEVLYGGAAGGGKSYGQIVDALAFAIKYPASRQLILRRTFPELKRSLILTALEIIPRTIGKYNDTNHKWTFWNNSVIEFGYCDSETDVTKYQGSEYDIIRFDELTHFTLYQYTYMISRVRGVNDYPKQIKSTTNPGGVGHNWVKARFIDGAIPETIVTDDIGRTRTFIPALVTENKFLMEADPNYVKRLEQLPESERKALLYGEWNIFSGQVFSEWRNNPAGYTTRQDTHVIEPFPIPSEWKRYRSFDFGYARPFAVQWWAVDFDGTVYLYRQLYGCTSTPNEGVKWAPDKIAATIREIEEQNEKGNKIIGVADPSIWDASRGEAIISMFERHRIYFDKADNTRIAGKMQLHYRLAMSEEGRPRLYVFNTCREFIRTIPGLLYDSTNVEDVDSRMEDHDYDACRYFLMTNPLNIKREELSYAKPNNPFSRTSFRW